eukprot:TRINITY_DN28082_c0_g1_i4.p1 TRINITY_DN28082_c0_g1~~TRINITY_DN28082_c0_g1_i4.p1  ORF type:complete len:367 (+),score=43.16 TRINITY_DN28082_c0_g1_i4:204-1304(+)
MCRHDFDLSGVYHGTGTVVSKYALADGKLIWRSEVPSSILFGWQSEKWVYAAAGKSVYCLEKKEGKQISSFACDNTLVSNAASYDGKLIFAADTDGMIYAFTDDGTRLWKLQTGCGTALSMQYCSEPQQLYVVTTKGNLVCFDVKESSITTAQAQLTRQASRLVEKPTDLKTAMPTTDVEWTTDASTGILVECVKDGGRLRIRAVSYPYDPDYNVQFPKNLRQEHARFVVEELVKASSGGFYRAKGKITRLQPADAKFEIIQTTKSATIRDQIVDRGHKFTKGCAFYEHVKREMIQSYKKLVLQDRLTGELFEGDAVRQLLALPSTADVRVDPTSQHTSRYRLFVQSTSNNRSMPSGSTMLFKKAP